jgi:hypothetical protein
MLSTGTTAGANSPGMRRGPDCPGRRPPRFRGLLGPTSIVESSAGGPALDSPALSVTIFLSAVTAAAVAPPVPTRGADVASAASSAADAARTCTLTRLRRISSRRSVDVFWAFSTDINRLLGNTGSKDSSVVVVVVAAAAAVKEDVACFATIRFALTTAAGGAANIMGGGASPPPAEGGLSALAGDCGRDGACGGVGGGSAAASLLILAAD